MLMWLGVIPSSDSAGPVLVGLTGVWLGVKPAAAWAAAIFLAVSAWRRMLGSSYLSSPKITYWLPRTITSGSLIMKMKPSRFLIVTRVIPPKAFMPSLVRALRHFFSPLLSLGASW